MSKSLKDTLNLPKTNFPMKADLATREPARLQNWQEMDLYHAALEKNAKGDTFILHDGPPYANGDIHMGHALNKTLKDIILRYKTMRGFKTPFIPGWDCHGLPIEQQILKRIGGKIFDMEPVELRKMCAEYAQGYVDRQRGQFKRLGILADWDKPYVTFDKTFETGILSCLLDLVKKGLIVKGYKAVHWDPVFRTALAEAEIEYHEHASPSIYVKFPLVNWKSYEQLASLAVDNVSLVIWTTTPWTMPANLGVSLNPELDYVALKVGNEAYIVAEGLVDAFKAGCGIEEAEVIAKFNASFLDKAECSHPIFDDRTSLVMLGSHVTLEQGTGCVHTAPGHGADDFIIGKAYGLPILVPVDEKGCFNGEFPLMQGEFVFDANPKIVELLREKGLLLGHKIIKHDYPFSWRSKKPIIFRATAQWFMRLEDGVKERALQAIDKEVRWIPGWGHDRIRSMVERRPEWCISRQRSWGVPIPAIRSKKSGDSILDARIIEKLLPIVAEKGTDAWYTEPVSSFLPEGFVYEKTGECSPEDFEKESDTLDVWFDSGATHIACLELDERVSSPADLYLEGSDQHRGWFQSSLLTSVGSRDRAPYKAVLTHGFILDGQGRAMSKSMGNTISPLDLIDKYGADVVRLWVSSLDFTNDCAVSEEIMGNTARAYRDIRNALRFQLGNLADFDATKDAVAPADLCPLDSWALQETALLIERVTEHYENYEFHKVYGAITQYCTVTLSALYHDILKDRLYTYGANWQERRSAQTVLHHSFDTLTRLLAPVMCFTCDEAIAYRKADADYASGLYANLQDWPVVGSGWKSAKADAVTRLLNEVRPLVNEKLEVLRRDKVIGKSVDAEVTISGSGELMDIMQA
ncbi:MAG: isoleucine--tRNA ligase, partial [Opitutales bacterium]|nr:isoleucine--tRNA ligase [Opitutales bacterium]